MPDIFDHLSAEQLAEVLRCPPGEVRSAAAGEPAGFRAYWSLHALKIAAGILPPDAPVNYMPPRPGGKMDFSDPWGCLVTAAGGWERLAICTGVALPTLKSWRMGIPAGSARVQSSVLRSLGFRPFFQFDWGSPGKGAKYRLSFRRPVLTLEEVANGV